MALIVALGSTVGSVASGGAQSTDDPRTAPVPTIEPPGQKKIFAVEVVFDGEDVVSSSVEVAYGEARTQVGAPPLYQVRLQDRDGRVLREFNLWPPNLARAEPEGGGDEFHVLPQVTGRVAFAFDADVATMELVDLQRSGAPVVTAVDLRPAAQDFCQQNPGDPDCQRVPQPTTSTTLQEPPGGGGGTTTVVDDPGTTTVVENPGTTTFDGRGVTTTAGGTVTTSSPSTRAAALSAGTGPAGSGAATRTSGRGALVRTGSDVLRMIAVAAWLVVFGSLLLLRQRRTR